MGDFGTKAFSDSAIKPLGLLKQAEFERFRLSLNEMLAEQTKLARGLLFGQIRRFCDSVPLPRRNQSAYLGLRGSESGRFRSAERAERRSNGAYA